MQNVCWQNCSSLYGYRYMRVCLLAFSLDRKQGFDLKREGKLCSVQLFCIPYGVGLGWGTVPSLHIKQKKSAFSFDATGKVSVTKKITDPNGHPNSQISPPPRISKCTHLSPINALCLTISGTLTPLRTPPEAWTCSSKALLTTKLTTAPARKKHFICECIQS